LTIPTIAGLFRSGLAGPDIIKELKLRAAGKPAQPVTDVPPEILPREEQVPIEERLEQILAGEAQTKPEGLEFPPQVGPEKLEPVTGATLDTAALETKEAEAQKALGPARAKRELEDVGARVKSLEKQKLVAGGTLPPVMLKAIGVVGGLGEPLYTATEAGQEGFDAYVSKAAQMLIEEGKGHVNVAGTPVPLDIFVNTPEEDARKLARSREPDAIIEEISQAEMLTEKELQAGLSKDVVERVFNDLSMLVTGLRELPGLMLDPRGAETAEEVLVAGMEEGRQLTMFIIGDTIARLEDPERAFESQPIQTLLAVMPALKIAKHLGNARAARLLAQAEKIKAIKFIKEKAKGAKLIAARKIEPVTEPVGRAKAAAKRFFVDPAAQPTKQLQKAAEELTKGKVEPAAAAAIERTATAVKRGARVAKEEHVPLPSRKEVAKMVSEGDLVKEIEAIRRPFPEKRPPTEVFEDKLPGPLTEESAARVAQESRRIGIGEGSGKMSLGEIAAEGVRQLEADLKKATSAEAATAIRARIRALEDTEVLRKRSSQVRAVFDRDSRTGRHVILFKNRKTGEIQRFREFPSVKEIADAFKFDKAEMSHMKRIATQMRRDREFWDIEGNLINKKVSTPRSHFQAANEMFVARKLAKTKLGVAQEAAIKLRATPIITRKLKPGTKKFIESRAEVRAEAFLREHSPAFDIAAEQAGKLFGDEGKRLVQDELADVVSEFSPRLAGSKKLRGQIIADAMAQAPPKLRRLVRREVTSMLDDMATSRTPKTYRLELPGVKKAINLQELISKRVFKSDDKAFKHVMTEAVESSSRRVAESLETKRISKLVDDELSLSRKLTGQDGKRLAPVDHKKMVKAHKDGEQLPNMLHVDPEEIWAKLDMDDPAQVALFDRLQRYKPASDRTSQYLGVGKGKLWLPKSLDSTISWKARAMGILVHEGWMHKANRWVKANLTARNIGTHLNNFSANILYQTMRLANPLTLVNMARSGLKWSAWRHGFSKAMKLTDDDIRSFEALERTTKLDTTRVDAELGAVKRSGMGSEAYKNLPHKMQGAINLPRRVVNAINRAMDRTYKWGDNIFKLEEYTRNWKRLGKQTKLLDDGQFFDVRTGAHARTRYTRRGGKYFEEGAKRPLSGSRLDDIRAKAAIQPALDIFFDYPDVPNLVTLIRGMPILSVASPFFVWQYKAMDIPGVKKGLLARLFEAGPSVVTDSPAINAQMGAEALRNLFRVQSMLGTAHALSTDPDLPPDMAKLMFSYRSNSLALEDMATKTNPMFVGRRTFEAINSFEPSMLGLTLFYTGEVNWGILGEGLDFDDLYPMDGDPKMRKNLTSLQRKRIKAMQHRFLRYRSGRRGADIGDALELAGLGGSALMDGYIEIVSPGLKFEWSKVGRAATSSFLGGLFGRTADVFMGIAPSERQERDIAQWAKTIDRMSAAGELAAYEGEYLRSGIRHIMGMAWPPWGRGGDVRNINRQTDNYFNRMRNELKKSMVHPLIGTKKERGLSGLAGVAGKWLKRDRNTAKAIAARAFFIDSQIDMAVAEIKAETELAIRAWQKHGAFKKGQFKKYGAK
jgi:hypothetical protein